MFDDGRRRVKGEVLWTFSGGWKLEARGSKLSAQKNL
jgi:hypothetical protein